MFSKAIVRPPSKSMVNGLTTAGLGTPDHGLALDQHGAYVAALEDCGLDVIQLPPDEQYPDSTFVEDVALLAGECAIVMNPGAASRQGEIAGIGDILKDHFDYVESLQEPDTADAGDIMKVGSHFFIGRSQRTNKSGAASIIKHLEHYGMSGSMVELKDMLHLKTGVAYLEHNNLVACGEFLTKPEFQQFNILRIEKDEAHAANCIWVNDMVLMPRGCPKSRATIEDAGYAVIELDISEYQKLDGGLSCLSLRF